MMAEPAATRGPIVRADRLTRRADGPTFVESITVEVRQGEVVAIAADQLALPCLRSRVSTIELDIATPSAGRSDHRPEVGRCH